MTDHYKTFLRNRLHMWRAEALNANEDAAEAGRMEMVWRQRQEEATSRFWAAKVEVQRLEEELSESSAVIPAEVIHPHSLEKP